MSATLYQTWRATLGRSPRAFAIGNAADGRTWTRAELTDVAAHWAAAVADPASLSRRRIAIAAANGIDWWQAFLGALSLDAIPVMIDHSEPRQRQAEIARSANAAWLWSEGEWMALGRTRRSLRRDVCLVKVTSGSTGVPKVWPFTHSQMLADGAQVCASMGICAEDINLGAIPLGHSYGLGNLVIPLVASGTAIVLVDTSLPNVLAAAAAKWRPTVFPTVPPVLQAVVRSPVEPEALRSLRLVVSAGAVITPDLADAFHRKFGRTVHNFYGSSETGGICYDRSGEATLSGRSVGSPLEGVRLRWRMAGRFRVESAAVGGRGTFSPLDLGTLNDAGELVLTGRAGRLAKIGARRVDLGEIEAALRGVPGVLEAHVAVDAGSRGTLAAAVASEQSKDQIRTALRERLPGWKIPGRILVLPNLPSTSRGKLDRTAIEALLFPVQTGRAAATPR